MNDAVLITGASGGIGTACARAAAERGFRVALHYHGAEQKARALAAELRAGGCDAEAFGADAADSGSVGACVRAAEARFAHLDGLICCAGVALQKQLQDVTDGEWRRVLDVNLSGAFYFIRAALPGMLARHRGSIVTVSSVWGVRGGSCEAAYSAAKAGLIGLTRALAQEVGPAGVRVNCLAPGVIDTAMCAGFSPETRAALAEETPLGRLGTPEDAARAALFLLEHPFVTGQVLGVDGGF